MVHRINTSPKRKAEASLSRAKDWEHIDTDPLMPRGAGESKPEDYTECSVESYNYTYPRKHIYRSAKVIARVRKAAHEHEKRQEYTEE
jgi:hypothetical protein